MTTLELEQQIRERHARATPGEWKNLDRRNAPLKNIVVISDGRIVCEMRDVHQRDCLGGFRGDHKAADAVDAIGLANCDFIAHAHQDVPFLLSRIDELKAERDEAKADAQNAGANCLAIINSLRWTGDGYEWNPDRDYRERPVDAIHAMARKFKQELAAAHAALAAERADVVRWLRHKQESFEASVRIQRRYVHQRSLGEMHGISKQEGYAETFRAAADAIERAEHKEKP